MNYRNNDYKLVAIDVDGTLLNNKHEVPGENIRVIRELGVRGVKFVIVTGRIDVMAHEFAAALGDDVPVIGCNGAILRDAGSGKIHFMKTIALAAAERLYEYFTSHGLYARFYTPDKIFTYNPYEFDSEKNPMAIFSNQLAEKVSFCQIRNFSEIARGDDRIVKIVFSSYADRQLTEVQQDLAVVTGVRVYRAAKDVLDIVAAGVSKGTALREYAAELGVTKAEVVAIGDSENDLPLLQAAGLPVAMGNAAKTVKEVAAFVTGNNDDCGVATALKRIFEPEADVG